MLLPSEIDKITEYINSYFVILEDDLVGEIADRISRVNEANVVVLNQTNILNQMGLLNRDVYKKVAQATNKTEKEIKSIISGAMITSFKRDNIIFSNELSKEKLKISESLLQTLQSDISRLNFNLNNLTNTTAMTTQTQFLNALNQAHLEVISGAKSYTSAMIDIMDKVGNEGIDVLYPSGHKDKVDVATRRAIVTSVNQTNGQLQLRRMEDLSWDLVEVSAHIGARPSHEVWQGQVYSLTGSNGYKNFYEETEYGDMLGLCGINCRHTFFPFYEGSTNTYDTKELERINNKKVTFNGKEMSYYDATQYQRKLERTIRKYNRQLEGNNKLLLNNKDIDIDQVKYSMDIIKSKKNGLLNELRELESQVGLKSDRLYTIGSEVKLYKMPKIENTIYENVKKNDIIGKATTRMATEEETKKVQKSIIYGMLEGENYETLKNKTENYLSLLDNKQKDALTEYSGSSYGTINGILRGKVNLPNESSRTRYENLIENLSSALNDKTLGQNAKLYRGVYDFHLDDLKLTPADLEDKSEDWFKEKLVGKVYTDKAFQSTSIDPSSSFSGKFKIEYNANEDTNGMYIADLSRFPNEKEFLINKNTSAIIQDVQLLTNGSGRKYLKIIAKIGD